MGHTRRPNVSKLICLSNSSCDTLWVTVGDFLWFFDSSHQDISNNTNNIVTRVLICLQYIFYFIFTFSLSLISLGVSRRVEGSDKKNTLKACWSSDSNITNIIEKILTRQISRHHVRLSTVTRMYHASHLKVNESWYIWIARVAYFGNYLWSFFYIVGFISSISFHWYRWYHRQSFGVIIEFFYFLMIFSSFFIVNYASLFLKFKRVANNIYNLWILYIICNFLYFSICFFFCMVLFYPIFFLKSAKNQKTNSAGCLVKLKNDVYRRSLEKNFIDFTILGIFHIQPTRLAGNVMLW